MQRSILKITLLIAALGCFIASWQFFGAGLMAVAEISSNPFPSEAAKIDGPRLMLYSKMFFLAGIICLGPLVLAFVWKRRRT